MKYHTDNLSYDLGKLSVPVCLAPPSCPSSGSVSLLLPSFPSLSHWSSLCQSLLGLATGLCVYFYIFVTTVLTCKKVHFLYIQLILKANRTREKFILHYQKLTLPVITLTFRPHSTYYKTLFPKYLLKQLNFSNTTPVPKDLFWGYQKAF